MNMEQEPEKVRETFRRLYSEKSVKNYPGPVPVVSFDTNRINSKQRLVAMNRIEELGRDGWIELRKSSMLCKELPEGSGEMRSKAEKTMEVGGEDLTVRETNQIAELENLLFPDREELSINDIRDARHVFDHMKYSSCCDWNFLITNDGAILNKKDELRDWRIHVGDDNACIKWLEDVLPILKARVHQHFESTKI